LPSSCAKLRKARRSSGPMLAIRQLFGTFVDNLFGSRRWLELENSLRRQLNIALRPVSHHLRLRGSDRALLVWMTWLWPNLLDLARVVQLTRTCHGIEQGFGPTGAGNLALGQGGPELAVGCAGSSDG